MSNLRILLVEDEMIVAMDLQQFLEDDGACVIGPATTVEESLELLGSEPIDCAVLDSNLGGVRAFPVADSLYASHVPFLFHTGYMAESVVEERWPGTKIVVKPANYNLISAVLAALVRDRPHFQP